MARNRTMMGDQMMGNQMMGNQFGQDASLIMADVADAANRAAATGQIDAIKREQDIARMQSRAAGQDRRAEKIGEAQDFAFDRSINRRYADIAENERAAARQDANRLLQNRLAAFTGAASTLASQYANYEAQQKALQKGLTLAEQKGGIKGAIDFLNANPDYDPGEETLQRLYAGSEIGKQTAAEVQANQDQLAKALFNAAEARRFEREFDPGDIAMSTVPGAMSDVQQIPQGTPISTDPFQQATSALNPSPLLALSQTIPQGRARRALETERLLEQLKQQELLEAVDQQLGTQYLSEPTLEDRLRLLRALGL